MRRSEVIRQDTPLAGFVRSKLAELKIKPTHWAAQNDFDQGLMSKIINGTNKGLTIETVCKLAKGFRTAPRHIFCLIGRPDLDD